MTRKRHPSARTTRAMRREIQQSEESDRALAARLGINPKTVAKWRGRRRITAFLANESGATAVEYALLASLIAIVIVTTVTAIGTKLNGVFNEVASNLK
jgi:pilus assembly protein Flp/PilA